MRQLWTAASMIERFVVRLMKPLNWLSFMFVIINAMIGIAILGDFLGSRVLWFAGAMVGMVLLSSVAIYGTVLLRLKKMECEVEQEKTREAANQPLPLQFIGAGAICVAVYSWAMGVGCRGIRRKIRYVTGADGP